MSTTLCFINEKGGVGKSSTCFHLAGAFAVTSLRVLVIDLDPQGSVSKGFLGPEAVENLPLAETTALLFDDCGFFADHSALIRPTLFENISLCPANSHLHSFNTPSPETLGVDQRGVSEFLWQYGGDYDLVLIDCPPNLYRCSWTAMLASDFVVIPVPPEDFGTQGLRSVHQAVEQVRLLNPTLRRLGHVVTRRDKKLLIHRHIDGELRDYYKHDVFQTVISELNDFKVAVSARKPVELFRPQSGAADLTRQLSREILDRIAEKTIRRQLA